MQANLFYREVEQLFAVPALNTIGARLVDSYLCEETGRTTYVLCFTTQPSDDERRARDFAERIHKEMLKLWGFKGEIWWVTRLESFVAPFSNTGPQG